MISSIVTSNTKIFGLPFGHPSVIFNPLTVINLRPVDLMALVFEGAGDEGFHDGAIYLP